MPYIYNMFQLGKTIVSEELLQNDFVCNLNACKGTCCVEGEAGAPLEPDETIMLKDIFPVIKPLLRPEGVAAIEAQGTHITNDLGQLETPLVQGKECAYVIFDHNNCAKCGIEEAYNKGLVDWKKPLSCHLYPVRIREYSQFSAVNYHRWPICDDACTQGKELQVPVYKFVKEALIRKFGAEWYAQLEGVAGEM